MKVKFILANGQYMSEFNEKRIDIVYTAKDSALVKNLPSDQKIVKPSLSVLGFFFNPCLPPFNDVRLRRALSLAVDWERLSQADSGATGCGWLIPPGMPGHSPDIRRRFDPETARRLLVEAGYPNGVDFSSIKCFSHPSATKTLTQIPQMWQEELGIRFNFEFPRSLSDPGQPYHLGYGSWVADYPDPDNILHKSNFINSLHMLGWRDQEYESLVETAASLPERGKRLALYRQADRMLVEDQALFIPIHYGSKGSLSLVQPWVKNYKTNLLGGWFFNEIIIEEH